MVQEVPRSTTPSRVVRLRPVLWCIVVLGAVGNVVASAASAGLAVHLVLGVVTVVALAGLVTLWMQDRP